MGRDQEIAVENPSVRTVLDRLRESGLPDIVTSGKIEAAKLLRGMLPPETIKEYGLSSMLEVRNRSARSETPTPEGSELDRLMKDLEKALEGPKSKPSLGTDPEGSFTDKGVVKVSQGVPWSGKDYIENIDKQIAALNSWHNTKTQLESVLERTRDRLSGNWVSRMSGVLDILDTAKRENNAFDKTIPDYLRQLQELKTKAERFERDPKNVVLQSELYSDYTGFSAKYEVSREQWKTGTNSARQRLNILDKVGTGIDIGCGSMKDFMVSALQSRNFAVGTAVGGGAVVLEGYLKYQQVERTWGPDSPDRPEVNARKEAEKKKVLKEMFLDFVVLKNTSFAASTGDAHLTAYVNLLGQFVKIVDQFGGSGGPDAKTSKDFCEAASKVARALR